MYSVVALIALTVGCVSAQAGYGANYVGALLAAPQTRGAVRVRPDEYYPPQPYNFDYNVDDGAGMKLYRQESGDASGVVRGNYGYQDPNGVYRNVDYVADAQGFRASVRTNEPGVGAANPADVTMDVQPPPAGLQEKYTRGTGYVPPPGGQRRPGGRGPF